MNEEVQNNRCTTCGEPTFFEQTMYLGLRKLHTQTGSFLCPEPSKPGSLDKDLK